MTPQQKGRIQGVCWSAAYMVQWRGEDVYAEELLKAWGVTKDIAKKANVDDDDLQKLLGVFNEIERKNKVGVK